jgi:hypothetical protein
LLEMQKTELTQKVKTLEEKAVALESTHLNAIEASNVQLTPISLRPSALLVDPYMLRVVIQHVQFMERHLAILIRAALDRRLDRALVTQVGIKWKYELDTILVNPLMEIVAQKIIALGDTIRADLTRLNSNSTQTNSRANMLPAWEAWHSLRMRKLQLIVWEAVRYEQGPLHGHPVIRNIIHIFTQNKVVWTDVTAAHVQLVNYMAAEQDPSKDKTWFYIQRAAWFVIECAKEAFVHKLDSI